MSPISRVIDLPISPLRSTVAEGDLHDAPVVATLMDGKTVTGRLAALDGPQSVVTLSGKANNRIYIEFSRLRHLNFINKLPVNRERHPLETHGGEVVMPREVQEFRIVFSDDRVFSGRTRGSFVDEIGIHLFQVIGADHISRLFIPARVVKKYSIGQNKPDEPRQGADKTVAPAAPKKPTPRRRKSDARGQKTAVQDARQLQEKLDSGTQHPGDLLNSKRIGEMLVEDGVITPEQLDAALAAQKRDTTKRLGEILVGMGTISSEHIFSALAHKFGMPFVLLRKFFIDIACLNLVPADVARKHMLVPLLLHGDRLVIAIDDPANTEAVTLLRFMTQYKIEPTIATREDIAWAIGKYYGGSSPETPAATARETSLADTIRERLKPAEQRHPHDQPSMAKAISSFVGNTIIDAIERNASDIHLIPAGSHANLMFRIDGRLVPVRRISAMLLPAILNRLAVMGNIEPSPTGGPRQGRACMLSGNSAIALRITLSPERVPDGAIIHVLNAVTRLMPVTDIGLDPRDQQILLELLSKSYSLVIVTGPENSGKTRTLYAALRELQSMRLEIATVETPVKYYVNGLLQIQGGLDLPAALAQVKAHNPRIVMIDDLHNARALQTAAECALNGSLVLGKLHAADAARAVTALSSAGVAPRLLNSTLVGVLAQHLLRLNCLFCAEEEAVSPAIRNGLGVGADEVFFRGTGCSHCNHSGYFGEQAVYELMPVSPAIQSLITAGAAAADIESVARSEGMSSLTENALHLARTRRTSLAEVHRLVGRLRDDRD